MARADHHPNDGLGLNLEETASPLVQTIQGGTRTGQVVADEAREVLHIQSRGKLRVRAAKDHHANILAPRQALEQFVQ